MNLYEGVYEVSVTADCVARITVMVLGRDEPEARANAVEAALTRPISWAITALDKDSVKVEHVELMQRDHSWKPQRTQGDR